MQINALDKDHWLGWAPAITPTTREVPFRPLRGGQQASLILSLLRDEPLLIVLTLAKPASQALRRCLRLAVCGSDIRLHCNPDFPRYLFGVLEPEDESGNSFQKPTELSFAMQSVADPASGKRGAHNPILRLTDVLVMPKAGKFSRYWASPWRRVCSRLLNRALAWSPSDFPYSHLDGLKYILIDAGVRNDLTARRCKTAAQHLYAKGRHQKKQPVFAIEREPNPGTLRAHFEWMESELGESHALTDALLGSLNRLQERNHAQPAASGFSEYSSNEAPPESSEALLRKANQLLSARHYAAALDAYRDFLERHPEAVHTLWPSMLLARQKYRAARRGSSRRTYADWCACFDYLPRSVLGRMRQEALSWPEQPLVSILMPVYAPNLDWLEQAIDSVKEQAYDRWELCIADDASPDLETRDFLRRCAAEDQRIRLILREENGHIPAATNSALSLAQGDYVALMDQDDLLAPHALFRIAQAISENPGAGLIYSDEDHIDEHGTRLHPYFKSDFDPFLMRGHNMVTHLGVYRTDLVRKLGGMREGFEGSQDWDLALRCSEQLEAHQIIHIPAVLYHWRSHSDSTARGNRQAKPYAFDSARRAITEHLQREKIDGSVELIPELNMFRTRYRLPAKRPLVSILICTRNSHHLLGTCLDSLFRHTAYSPFEVVLVDNGSDDPATLARLRQIASRPNVTVLRDDGPFNFSRLNNAAARQARGEFLLLLNNDTEITEPNWLSDMVSLGVRKGVGAVGARLWYPDRRMQHGGVVLGLGGVAAHAHRRMLEEHNGYFCRAKLTNSFSAVTGACLLVRKGVFEQVGGLDEEHLTVAYNDVDFCLKIREAGYRNVLCATANLIHHESASRGADDVGDKLHRRAMEAQVLVKRWPRYIAADPAYNPNLTDAAENFSLAWPPRCRLASDIASVAH